MKSLTIEVEHLQRGQPAPYAPHTYESRITITGERSWDRILESRMPALVKALVHPFLDEDELAAKSGMDAHYSPKLTRLERQEREKLDDHPLGAQREVWIARVETPFTD